MADTALPTIELELDTPVASWATFSARNLRDHIRRAAGQPLRLNIHSGGGDVLEGLAIVSVLAEAGNVTTHNRGFAGSMASVILAAGKERTMAADAWIMIHKPWTVAWGDDENLAAEAKVLDQLTRNLAEAYARNTKLSVEEALKLMNEHPTETGYWINAEDALKMGFIDRITDADPRYGKAVASAKAEGRIFASAGLPPPPLDPTPEPQTQPAQPPMSAILVGLYARLAIAADATDAQAIAALDKILADHEAKATEAANATAAANSQAAVTKAVQQFADAVAKHHNLNEAQTKAFKIVVATDPGDAVAMLPAPAMIGEPAKRLDNAQTEGTQTDAFTFLSDQNKANR